MIATSETRYAILIGMDKYPGEELPYSVKDANDLKGVLIENCRFSKENVFLITEGESKAVKQQIDEALVEIEKTFKPKEDLLLFYFSGHGESLEDQGKSKILFEDNTELTIEDILLRYFVKLSPRNQYLLIDSCHSGSNVFFKGNNKGEEEIQRLNYYSSELCLMFATESKNVAYQGGGIENSYFTFFLIEAIKNMQHYDEDGFLTIQAIDNYIKKKVMEKSDFVQIPVSEIRSSGYKVFSFDEATISRKSEEEIIKKMKKIQVIEPSLSGESLGLTFEDSLRYENRQKIQAECEELIKKSFSVLKEKLGERELEVLDSNPFNELPYGDQQKVFKRVIDTANKNKIEAVEGLFEVTYHEKRRSHLFGIIDYLQEETKPDSDYKIYTNSTQMFSTGLSVKSGNVNQVTSGLFALFFQAKYGFGLCIVKYRYDWTGTSDSELKYINVNIKPFLLNEKNDSNIISYLKTNVEDFSELVAGWTEDRKKEIEAFKTKVKNSTK